MSIGEEEVTRRRVQVEERHGLIGVGFDDQRTKEELGRGTILFRNESHVGVRIDQEAFSALLRREGLSPGQINGIEVVFRSATFADRSFYGRVIGGLHPSGLGPIEVYTTFVTDNNRVYETHLPVRVGRVVKYSLHEIGHRGWRLSGKQPSDSFYARTYEESQTGPSEEYAAQFAAGHLEEFEDGLEIYALGFLPFEDNTGPDRRVGELEIYGECVDLDRRIVVINPDNPVLYFEDEIDRKVFSVEDLRDFSEDKLKGILGRAATLVNERKLGMYEYNYLIMKLKVAFAERGNRAQADLIEKWKIKPPS